MMSIRLLSLKKFVYLLLLLLTGCSASESNRGENVISIKVDEFSPVTDFFDSYKFVVLETTDGSLISNESIFRTSDRYIVSYSPQSGFVIFDNEGKYLNSFDHKGEGPEEYVQLTDYYIKNETIYAVAGFFKKILEYEIISGECLAVHPIDGEYVYASPLTDEIIVLGAAYNSSTLYNFAIFDLSSDTTLNVFSPYNNRTSFTLSNFNSFVGANTSDGVVYGVLPYNNDLYSITSDACEVCATYAFNTSYKLPDISPEDLIVHETWEKVRFEKMVQRLLSFYKMPSGACYQAFEIMLEYGYIPMICRYDSDKNSDKKDAKTLRLNVEIFDEFPFLYGCPFEFRSEYCLTAVSAHIALNTASKFGLDLFSGYDLTEESNPVIFFHHFKN